MASWLKAALDYVPAWIEHQMALTEQPGCAIAITHKGKVVLERAFGIASERTGEKLTPRHRFRIASHSKTFTAAAIMLLREDGRLSLDDPAGLYVEGLHPDVAAATLEQLLSHSSGLIRDGGDAGQWQNERPFLDEADLRRDLAAAPVIAASTRFKYSNHAFGLLGLVIEAVTGETYGDFVTRAILKPHRLTEITPDMPLPAGTPFVTGHGRKLPLGRRPIVPGDNPTHALAAATGFVASAGHLARFFASLDPAAASSPLTPSSRRDMTRRQWSLPHMADATDYGLGVSRSKVGDWSWFGHGGAFQSGLSTTMVIEGRDLAVCVLTNAIDGPAAEWAAGIVHILQTFEQRGAATARTRDWSGRWWSLWHTADLVPVADGVLVADPALLRPLDHAAEIAVTGRDKGFVRLAGGYDIHGEGAALRRDGKGAVAEVVLGGSRLLREAAMKRFLKRRFPD
jgi:D-alanyl-D-alanine carboxypeptidase